MEEIEYASERDLAIRNVDRESTPANQVKAALRRLRDAGFRPCIECDPIAEMRQIQNTATGFMRVRAPAPSSDETTRSATQHNPRPTT
jgi:RNA polymerase-binding transcription factor DksA